jgi:hypothetical protein
MSFYRINQFSRVLLPLFILLLLTGCSKKEGKRCNIEEYLISQIDWQADDYLASLGEDEQNIISLKSLSYGSFTGDNTSEILCLFHIDAPHTGGMDRTIAAIYDEDSLKYITKKTFMADDVSLYLFHDILGKTNILYIGETVYQGIASHQIDLIEIQNNDWVSKKISDIPLEDSDTFAVSSDKYLHVFQIEYNENMEMELHYKYTLTWDAANGRFTS